MTAVSLKGKTLNPNYTSSLVLPVESLEHLKPAKSPTKVAISPNKETKLWIVAVGQSLRAAWFWYGYTTEPEFEVNTVKLPSKECL